MNLLDPTMFWGTHTYWLPAQGMAANQLSKASKARLDTFIRLLRHFSVEVWHGAPAVDVCMQVGVVRHQGT